MKSFHGFESCNHQVENEVVTSPLGSPKDKPCTLWKNGGHVSNLVKNIKFSSVKLEGIVPGPCKTN